MDKYNEAYSPDLIEDEVCGSFSQKMVTIHNGWEDRWLLRHGTALGDGPNNRIIIGLRAKAVSRKVGEGEGGLVG